MPKATGSNRPARKRRKSPGSRKRSRQNKSNPSTPFQIGGIILGVAVVVGFVLIYQVSNSENLQTQISSVLNGSSNQTGSTENSTETEQQRQLEVPSTLVRKFGTDKLMTVVFEDVTGDPEAAIKYLDRKLFRSAYEEYHEGSRGAREQTAKNRKEAERKAVAEQMEGSNNFSGPVFVRFFYKTVRSDVPYPQIHSAGHIGHQFTFHVGPVLNPQAFVDRIDVGDVSKLDGRTVHIRTQLSNPVPDPDVEELEIRYGHDRILHLKIANAQGESKKIEDFLKMELRHPRDASLPDAMVGFKSLGAAKYELCIAPVDDVEYLFERLDWAVMSDFDETERIASVQFTIPEGLTSIDGLIDRRLEQDAANAAMADADYRNVPRPGESELDWALRAADTAWKKEKGFQLLVSMEVDEKRREEVSKFLLERLDEKSWHFELILEAALRWKTEKTEDAILALNGRGRYGKKIMAAVATFKTEKSATAIASGLEREFFAEDAVGYLIELETVAEKPVQKYLKHPTPRVRTRVYNVLTKIGTEDSIKLLKENYDLEKTPKMKEQAKTCLDAITKRVNQSEGNDSESK